MKYHIEKDTVQETLVIPMYARKKCTEKFPELFQDETAVKLMEKIDYDFSELENKSKSTMQEFGFLEVAMRQNDLAWEIKNYLEEHPDASVVNLGCGLDNTGRSCDNGLCRIYNIDFPDVIAARNDLLPAGEREENIAADLTDISWFEKINAENGVIFFAAGVFYYFLTEDVKKLFCAMAERFSGARLIFDAAGKKAVKLMLKTWIKQAEIKNVGAYFFVGNVNKDIAPWSEKFKVSSRGYMLGYNDLKAPCVKKFYRFLAKLGDGIMKMKIVRIDFVR